MTYVVFALALVALVIVVAAIRAFTRGLRGENEGRAALPSESNAASANFEPWKRARGTPSKAMRDAQATDRMAAGAANAHRMLDGQRQAMEAQRDAGRKMNEAAAKRFQATVQAHLTQAHNWAKRNRGW